MAETIYSDLWKAVMLSGSSSLFPLLVRGACSWVGIPYSEPVLHFAATRREILVHMQLTDDNSIDEVLKDFAVDPATAPELDRLIIAAVEQYKTTTESEAL